MLALTSGGELGRICGENGTPLIKIPGGMPPRTAIGYLAFPLLVQIEKLGLAGKLQGRIKETLKLLESMGSRLTAAGNEAKIIAEKLYGKLSIIYGTANTAAAALRWRTQINENSKMLASTGVFPEMNHNEIVGWDGPKSLLSNSNVVILRDKLDNKRVQKRIEITKSLIAGHCSGIEEVWAEGESLLARLFSLIYFGDFVSFYLASLNRIDPTPVKRIELLKERLREI